MKTILIHNAKIINEGNSFKGSLLIKDDKISKIFKEEVPADILQSSKVIDGEEKWLIPGVIDTHVHFREPGLAHKGDIYTESKAAVAGGITSFVDMPNTMPQTISMEFFDQKAELAAQKSLANFSFYLGATNDNIDEIIHADPKKVCGIKVFLGSSTGNMLVNKTEILEKIFAQSSVLVATHNEDEDMIQANIRKYKAEFGDNPIPLFYHELIRSSDACYSATAEAIELAQKYNTRLHVLHLSTAKELALFKNISIDKKQITAETCVGYLWFDDRDYERLGSRIKCNPSIKKEKSRLALLKAVENGYIDTIATDHAPHLLSEKDGDALHAVSGFPSVQHALPMMLDLAKKGNFTREQVVEKMCHNPALIFNIEKRGFIRKGFYADLTLIEPNSPFLIEPEGLLYKCGWSPLEGTTLSHKVTHTFVNGKLVYNQGVFEESHKGRLLDFTR
jgi:dihydroorotase